MMRLAKNESVFERYLGFEELVTNLEKVTVDEVVAIAMETFQTNQVSLVTLGPIENKDLDLEFVAFH